MFVGVRQICLLALDALGLSTEVGAGGLIAAEDRLQDRAEERPEDNLGTAKLRQSHPEDQDELEDVVEGLITLATSLTREGERTYGTSIRR